MGQPPADGREGMASERAEAMPPFLVMEVLERARALEREGRRVVHLEVGEPDFPTPAPIVEAGVAALREGSTRYTPSLGLPELREALAARYREETGIAVSAEQVVVTTGTSAALHLILTALLDPGDEVLVTDPGYACYPNFVSAAGGVVRRVPVERSNGFRPDPERVAAALTPRTRAILVNSPANPTGAVLRPADWEGLLGALARTARDRGASPWIVSDEIYRGLVYGSDCPTALRFTGRGFVIDGFSKRYAMTGWRLGYCVVPPAFVRPVQKLQQNLYICAPAPAQRAALAALTSARHSVAAAVADMVATYRRRRDALLAGLDRLGLPAGYVPEGAFYVLVDVRDVLKERGWWPAGRRGAAGGGGTPGSGGTGPAEGGKPLRASPSYRLALDLLERAGVAVTPGVDFGPGGEGCLRFSYAASLEDIEEALRRLRAYLRGGRSWPPGPGCPALRAPA